jgi:predicted enzyme related to lactoylglutathione lyase
LSFSKQVLKIININTGGDVMKDVKEYAPGTFSWVDLATSDSDAAKQFYSSLFGWSPVDNPAGPDMIYTMLELENMPVAALYEMDQEQRDRGVPPHWNSYVTVSSADEIVAKAKSLGGTVIMEASDVGDAGRMAMLQDPTGALFAVWQPKQNIGAKIVNEAGTLCWNELATNDTARAESFYTALFGWSSETGDMGGGMMYTSFKNGDRMAAGMVAISPEWGDVPPNWMVYFAVDDCDAIAARVESSGGQILNPPTDVPDVGRFAMALDPQGAAFAFIQLVDPQ